MEVMVEIMVEVVVEAGAKNNPSLSADAGNGSLA